MRRLRHRHLRDRRHGRPGRGGDGEVALSDYADPIMERAVRVAPVGQTLVKHVSDFKSVRSRAKPMRRHRKTAKQRGFHVA